MLRYRADVTVVMQILSNGDRSESDEMSDDDVAERYVVFVAAAEHKDTDARCHSTCCVANNTEIALKHLSETWIKIIDRRSFK